MTDLRRAYSSTVVAPWNIVASMAVAAALCAATARLPPPGPAMAAAGAAVIVLAGIHLATVRLTISPERLRLGQGPWPWPARSISAAEVLDAHAENLGLAQIFGVGVPFHRRTTRLTVRPGPTLVLVLGSGESIRVSTPDPEGAARLIGIRDDTSSLPASGRRDDRDWQRTGFGGEGDPAVVRAQTGGLGSSPADLAGLGHHPRGGRCRGRPRHRPVTPSDNPVRRDGAMTTRWPG